MADLINLGERRMERMTTTEQIEHVYRLIDKIDHFVIKSASEMLELLKYKHQQQDSTAAICLHLIYVGFFTGDEGADYTGDELLKLVEDNLTRYKGCLYRKLKQQYPCNPEVDKLNPLKSL